MTELEMTNLGLDAFKKVSVYIDMVINGLQSKEKLGVITIILPTLISFYAKDMQDNEGNNYIDLLCQASKQLLLLEYP